MEYVTGLSFIYSSHASLHRRRWLCAFKKRKQELCMLCPRFYANMYIFMPICSQLSVLLEKSGEPGCEPVLLPAVCREGAPMGAVPVLEHRWCRCSGLGLLAHQMGGSVKPQAGNYFLLAYSPLPAAGVCLGSIALHQDVLCSRLGCNSIPWLSPAPKGSNSRKRREMGIYPLQPPSSANFSLYQHFVPLSLAKAIGKRSRQEI